MRRASLMLLVALSTGCAGTVPAPTRIANSQTIQADYDTTWQAVVRWFAITNNPIATIDKESGIIATDQVTDATGALDCGKPGYGYAYEPLEIRLNVFVRRVTATTTDIRVTVTGRVLRFGDIGATRGQSEWRTCYSRGSFERDLIESVEKAVGK